MDRFVPLINVTELTTFFRIIVLCSNYSTIVILYENSTIPILAPILLSSSSQSSMVINIDLAQVVNNATIYSDEHSLIISVFDNDLVKKANQSRRQYGLKSYCHYLFASRDISAVYDNLITFSMQYKLDNSGVVLINKNGSISLFRIIYDQLLAVKFVGPPNSSCSIYEKMFYPKTIDLKAEDKYFYAIFDPPRVINIKSRNTNGEIVTAMGGREAYLASLIPRKMNITIKVWTIPFSEYDKNNYNENNSEYKFMKDFLEKTYDGDNLTPYQLDYITFVNESWRD